MANDKITVIGFTRSGKTCYLAGMYNTMSYGLKNFTLFANNPDLDKSLELMWNGIPEVYPPQTDKEEIYTFNLSHSLDLISEFDWVDYPGGFLKDTQGKVKIINHLKESSCIILIISGESFGVNASDVSEYKKSVRNKLMRNGDMEAIKCLSEIGKEIDLPPIVVAITKSDLIENDKIPYLQEIIKENFSPIFGEGSNTERLVMICAVTLGDLVNSKEVDPEYIELPIAFAVLTILCRYIALGRVARGELNSTIDKAKSGILGGLFNGSKIETANSNIAKTNAIIEKFSKDAVRLLDLFDSKKKLYKNGQEVNLQQHFEKFLRE